MTRRDMPEHAALPIEEIRSRLRTGSPWWGYCSIMCGGCGQMEWHEADDVVCRRCEEKRTQLCRRNGG